MNKLKLMSKLGKVVGTISKKSSIVIASVVEVLNNGKADFVAGYNTAMDLENESDIEKVIEIRDNYEASSPNIAKKVGFGTYYVLSHFKEMIDSMREWYRNKMTVITEGTEEEHRRSVSDRISHITSVISHSLCVLTSTLFFGATSLITLGLCVSLVYELYIG
jgi:hypothetical protein